MKISDWKAVETIETLIDSHHSGHMPADELLDDIAKVLNDFGHDVDMRAAKSAYLLGQIHGKLHGLIEKASTESVRHDLTVLFQHVGHVVERLYYKHKQEVKDENITN